MERQAGTPSTDVGKEAYEVAVDCICCRVDPFDRIDGRRRAGVPRAPRADPQPKTPANEPLPALLVSRETH